jgi:hypothetical protein
LVEVGAVGNPLEGEVSHGRHPPGNHRRIAPSPAALALFGHCPVLEGGGFAVATGGAALAVGLNEAGEAGR